jgi:Tfp pilus assembly protein PilF
MNVEELIKKGDDFRHIENYDEALSTYDAAIDILDTFPDSFENKQKVLALSGKSIVFRRLKKHEDALITIDMAIKADPESTKSWNNKGYILRDLKRYEEALKAFNTSLDIHSKIAANYSGVSYSWNGKELVLHGLKCNNNSEITYSWNGKGLVLSDLRRYEEALKAFKKSINIDPESAFSWNGKGSVYLSYQKYNEAIEAYDTALSKEKINNTEKIFALNGKGVAFTHLKKYDIALDVFEKSIDLNLYQGVPYNGKGLIYWTRKQFDQAIESFKQSIQYDPDYIHSFNSLAMLYLETSNLKEATLVANNSFYKNPRNYLTLFLKGKIELEKQNYDNAIYFFEEAISQSPGDPLTLFWEIYAKYLKAEVNYSLGDKKYQDIVFSCIRELEKVSAFNSTDSKPDNHISRKIEAYNNYFLGCCYYKLGDYFSAKEKFIECLNLSSEPEIAKSAKQLVDDLWNYKINTPVFKWWFDSPLYSIRRKITLSFLLFSIFGVLLPQFSHLLISFLYDLISRVLLPYPSLSKFLNYFFQHLINPLLTLLSFIDWRNNTTQYTLLILLLFFFLIYPCIKSFKSSEVEIEIQSPNPIELTPILIEMTLKELEKDVKPLPKT